MLGHIQRCALFSLSLNPRVVPPFSHCGPRYIGFVIGSIALYDQDTKSPGFVLMIGFGAGSLIYLAVVELIPECYHIAVCTCAGLHFR